MLPVCYHATTPKMKPLTIKVVFDRKGKASNSKDLGVIELSCNKNGRIYLSTGIKVTREQYLGSTQMWVNKDNDQYKVYNVLISQMIQKLVQFDNEQMLKDNDYNAEVLKQVFHSKPIESFLQFFEEEYKDNPGFKLNTIKNYRSCQSHLEKFGKMKYFSDLTYANVEAFNRYLLNLGLQDTSIGKYHKYTKRIINESIKKGYLDENKNPYKNFKIRFKTPEKVCLTVLEIKTLERLVVPEKSVGVQRALDMFMFSIYTGVRFSDLQQISSKTIHFKEDGIYFEYKAIKTEKKKVDNLHIFFTTAGKYSKPEQIIVKYKDYLGVEPFKIELATYNKHLKEIAKLAKFTKNLTSHIARHTFLTFMADKVSPLELMELAQHSDFKTTMGYVHMKDKIKQEGLKKVDWDY